MRKKVTEWETEAWSKFEMVASENGRMALQC